MDDAIRSGLQLPPRASTDAPGIDHLHFAVLGLALATMLVAFAAIAYFTVRGRRLRPAHNGKLELAFAGITLAVFLALWVVGFGQLRAMRSPPADATQIYVVAKQWMWSFVYPDGTAAQDDLRVPVGQPIELLLTSRDVIHSFYVPAFRTKEDVLPGRMTSLLFTATAPGVYPIRCAEYCGAGHARMSGTVIALPPADYARWLASQRSGDAPDLATAGAHLAVTHGCLRCHDAPAIAPALRGIYGTNVPLVGGTTATVDAAYVTESLMDPAAKVHAGYAPTMPSYLGQLSAAETAALVEYIREAKP